LDVDHKFRQVVVSPGGSAYKVDAEVEAKLWDLASLGQRI